MEVDNHTIELPKEAHTHAQATVTRPGEQRSKGGVVVLELEATHAARCSPPSAWRTTRRGLGLRIEPRTAVEGVAFAGAAAAARTLRKPRTIGFMRMFVATRAAPPSR